MGLLFVVDGRAACRIQQHLGIILLVASRGIIKSLTADVIAYQCEGDGWKRKTPENSGVGVMYFMNIGPMARQLPAASGYFL